MLGKCSKASTTASSTANLPPLALALSATIPLAFATFIALQLLWAATDDHTPLPAANENTKPDWLSAKKPRITPISAPTKERKT